MLLTLISQEILDTNTLVLPVPAPAITSIFCNGALTACFWLSFRFSRIACSDFSELCGASNWYKSSCILTTNLKVVVLIQKYHQFEYPVRLANTFHLGKFRYSLCNTKPF